MPHTTYTIGTVASLTGVQAWRLRAWENKGLLSLRRSQAGYRLFDQRDVARVVELRDSIDQIGPLGAHVLATTLSDADAHKERASTPIPFAYHVVESEGVLADALQWCREATDSQWVALIWPASTGQLEYVATTGRPDLVDRPLHEKEQVEWLEALYREASDSEVLTNLTLDGIPGNALTARRVRLGDDYGAVVLIRPTSPLPAGTETVLDVAVRAALELRSVRRKTAVVEQRLAVTGALGRVIDHSYELDELLGESLTILCEFFGMEAGLIGLAEPTQQRLSVAAHRGVSRRFVESLRGFGSDEGIGGRAHTAREPLLVSDLTNDPRVTRQAVRKEGIRTYVSIPLLHRATSLGVMELGSRRAAALNRDGVEHALLLAKMLAAGVANSNLIEERDQVCRDNTILHRSWLSDIARARDSERAAVIHSLKDIATAGGDYVTVDSLGRLISRLHERGPTVLDPVEALQSTLPSEMRDLGTDVVVVALEEWPGIRSEKSSAEAVAAVRQLAAAAAANDALRVTITFGIRGKHPAISVSEEHPPKESIQTVKHFPAGVRANVDVTDARRVHTSLLVLDSVVRGSGKLTRREEEVLKLLILGASTRQTARNLGISEKTLGNHLTTIYRKLGVACRQEAIREGLRRGTNPSITRGGDGNI